MNRPIKDITVRIEFNRVIESYDEGAVQLTADLTLLLHGDDNMAIANEIINIDRERLDNFIEYHLTGAFSELFGVQVVDGGLTH